MLKLAFLALLFAPAARASSFRNFTADEIKRHFTFEHPIRQIYAGAARELTVSLDGRYLAFTEATDDIHTNTIVLLDTETQKIRRISEPYGWKSNPIVLGGEYDDGYSSKHPRQLLAIFKRGTYGIFSFNMDDPNPKWTPWLKQEVMAFAISTFGEYLAYVLGRHGEPGPAQVQELPNEHLNIQNLSRGREAGRPVGRPTEIATELKGYFGDPQFDYTGDKILFEHSDMTYIVARKAGAKPTELLSGISGLDSIKFGAGLPGAGSAGNRPPHSSIAGTIVFSRLVKVGDHSDSTGHLHQMDLDTRVTDIYLKCHPPVPCFEPVFAPWSKTFYFVAQIGTEAGGIFETHY